MILIKIIIADDQNILREGLNMILNREEDIKVCGLASNGEEAIDLCKWNLPDLVLMDIKMPGLNGVEATKIIKEKYPSTKVLVLTTFSDDEYIFDALKYGASGYLLKDATPDKILEAIRTIYTGGALIQPDIATKVLDRFTKIAGSNVRKIDKKVELLTGREMDICRLLGEGKNNKEIAEILFLSEGTVKNHITNILQKLDLRDRTQLAIFSVKNLL